MASKKKDPLWGAAVLKYAFMRKGRLGEPGFRVVYFGTLKELDLKDSEVDAYIRDHRDQLEAQFKGSSQSD